MIHIKLNGNTYITTKRNPEQETQKIQSNVPTSSNKIKSEHV